MLDQPHIVILAAGLGTRFRQHAKASSQHKALVPIWDDRGTLALLLHHLKTLDVAEQHITIATGYMSEAVSAAVTSLAPNIQCLFNPDFSTDSLLQTLARTIAKRQPQQACWVLFADTLYTQQALQQLFSITANPSGQQTLQVAVCARTSPLWQKTETALTLTPNQQQIIGFNTEDHHRFQMAHAVYWPLLVLPQLIDAVLGDGAKNALTVVKSQWQLLQQWQAATHMPIGAIHLAPHSTFDIDSMADLQALQYQTRVTAEHLQYFARNLCKDQRSALQSDRQLGATYLKQCSSAQSASHERQIMQYLYQQEPTLVPKIIGQQQATLQMKLAAGIRLYDLLRAIKNCVQADAIKQILLQRCDQRLHQFQHLFKQSPQPISSEPYPFDLQISQLIRLLTDILAISPPAHFSTELAQLAAEWPHHCSVPFRDATPKNIIVTEPLFSPSHRPADRYNMIQQFANRDLNYWQQVPLLDIDFTSTCHLTTPEDDFISLHAHASTFSRHFMLQLQQHADTAQQARLDLTMLVRYLRFGGRKLAYQLLNPRGFAVRFRYDDPCFYFEQLLLHLSAQFQQTYPALMAVLNEISQHAERYRGIALNQHATDLHLSALDKPLHYWQESPLEYDRGVL